jgi:hypothetical protein
MTPTEKSENLYLHLPKEASIMNSLKPCIKLTGSPNLALVAASTPFPGLKQRSGKSMGARNGREESTLPRGESGERRRGPHATHQRRVRVD